MRKGWDKDQYLLKTIVSEKDVQAEILREAIRRLEEAGTCHANFHLLALTLFGNQMETTER
jgi:hypothetical protein